VIGLKGNAKNKSRIKQWVKPKVPAVKTANEYPKEGNLRTVTIDPKFPSEPDTAELEWWIKHILTRIGYQRSFGGDTR